MWLSAKSAVYSVGPPDTGQALCDLNNLTMRKDLENWTKEILSRLQGVEHSCTWPRDGDGQPKAFVKVAVTTCEASNDKVDCRMYNTYQAGKEDLTNRGIKVANISNAQNPSQ